jgi:hypothetical protein
VLVLYKLSTPLLFNRSIYGMPIDQPSPKTLPCWTFWLLYTRSKFGCRPFLPGGIEIG